ncbi:glutathione transferase GstA [Paraburkholderia guartelaensis]|uniref:Glutathione transferase GstA n=1 Tax=Paraburkholderia guartelaensis TaxID=2546446 RepID=A0A4R5L7N5_9BURK|nr:glutathione transferase GstA [Paraburkholderia guartelaensis]TDG04445.1 glutathione transferase GstA [Paraburkholderia guartelaensis]
MKIYYSPGACSLASHIVAREAGIAIQLERVDMSSKRTQGGIDFLTINPKGNVPVLELDDGMFLTEGPAIMQFLADLKPERDLVPRNGTMARYRLQEWLGFINSDLHTTYAPLFNPAMPESIRNDKRAVLFKYYALVERSLTHQQWLLGERFSVADAYLFTVTNWARHVGVDFSRLPAVTAFQQRAAGRPQVREALMAEGLLRN